MKYEQLRVLEAIVSQGTFRAAAERLNKSQSAISNAVKNLEDELQIEVLSRASYRPTLTQQGEVFYREALRVLHHMRELERTAGRLRAQEESELRLAISGTLPLPPLLEALKDVGQRHPATHIRLSTENMGGPVARLMEGHADIAIASLADVSIDAMETHPVAETTIRPMASPEFVAKIGGDSVSQAILQTHIQVVVAGTGGQNFEQSRDLLTGGNKWTVTDFSSKKEVILAGLGWGGLPDHFTTNERRSGRLVPITVASFPPRTAVLHAIRRRDVVPGAVATSLWERLIELAPVSE